MIKVNRTNILSKNTIVRSCDLTCSRFPHCFSVFKKLWNVDGGRKLRLLILATSNSAYTIDDKALLVIDMLVETNF